MRCYCVILLFVNKKYTLTSFAGYFSALLQKAWHKKQVSADSEKLSDVY